MNLKKYLILYVLFLCCLLLTFLNIRNQSKLPLYFLTIKTKELSLGNFITISFVAGYGFSSLLNSFIKSGSNTQKVDEINIENKNEISDKPISEDNVEEIRFKPPERDLRDSQPTVSVNYRVVSQIPETFRSQDSNAEINGDFYEDGWGKPESNW